MDLRFFESIYKNLHAPVMVCSNKAGLPIEFMNKEAKIMFGLSNFEMQAKVSGAMEALRFKSQEEQNSFYQLLSRGGEVNDYKTTLQAFDDRQVNVNIATSTAHVYGQEYIVMYFYERDVTGQGGQTADIMYTILNTAYHAVSVDEALQTIINIAGESMGVSRVYVFEDAPGDTTRNTYEWCAPGVQPYKDNLQDLKKEDYDYDSIVSASGMFITDDTRQLDERYRHILLDMQGIKSIAILPLYYQNQPLGYIGFDDCEGYRKWSREEIHFLQNLAGIVSVFLNRRNSENEAKQGRQVLQTIFDNADNLIYVTDIKSYKILFANKPLADALGKRPDELVGTVCWQTVQYGQDGPCDFCPLKQLVDKDGNYKSGNVVWENRSGRTKKWYYVKSCIIPWVDGEYVHMQTSVDISYRKEYESQLEHFASTDSMTGVHNRPWGYRFLKELYATKPDGEETPYSLCFLDLDGLKHVNDTYGHQMGDEMIRQTIEIIRSRIRKSDVLLRWGGDEFLILLKCNTEKADKTMQRIRYRMETVNEEKTNSFTLSFSYGLIPFVYSEGETVDTLVTRADSLMYEEKIKKKGKK